jgi:hypothetical protein
MIYKRTGHWHLDVTIHGVRYREALNTTDKRQAKELEKNRIAQIKQGKNVSKTGREFARKPFHDAVKVYLEEREPHVSERTMQFETERLGPLMKHFGEKPLLRFKAEDVSGCWRFRPHGEHGNRRPSSHAETRQSLECHFRRRKGAPRGARRRCQGPPARPEAQAVRDRREPPEWMVAHCAAVLAVSTTCRGVEIKNLRAGRMWICSAGSQRFAAARPQPATEPFR